MDKCNNRHYRELLHAYELGFLKGDKRRELELHILECRECQEDLKDFQMTINVMREEPEVEDAVKKIVGDEREAKPSMVEDRIEKPIFREKRKTVYTTIIAAAAVLLFLIFNPWDIEFKPTKEAVAIENRLAILFFENLANESDPSNYGKIITNLLITDLSESQYVQVLSSQRLNEIIRYLGKDELKSINRDIGREIAGYASSQWMLMGSILQEDPNLVVSTQLIDIPSGDVMATSQVSAEDNESVFSVVDRLTVNIKNQLSLPPAALDELDPAIADVTTSSPEAYRYYIEGLEYFNMFYFDKSYESHEKAIEYDTTFAMAYYFLAWRGDTTMLNKALKYSDKATKKEQLYILGLKALFDRDDVLFGKYMEEIIERYPNEKAAVYDLSMVKRNKGDSREGIRLLKQAIEIDPLYKLAYNTLAYYYAELDYFDSALAIVDEYIQIAQDEPNPYDTKGDILAHFGYLDDAITTYEKAYNIDPDFFEYSPAFALGRLHVIKGDYEQARDYYREIVAEGDLNPRSYARTYLALVPLYQGKYNEALEILEDAIAADGLEHSGSIRYASRVLKPYMKSRIFIELDSLDLALKEFGGIISILEESSPRTIFSYYPARSMILVRMNRVSEAYGLADEILTAIEQGDEPDSSRYFRTMSRIEYWVGNYETALTWFEKAGVAKSLYIEDKFLMGKTYLELDQVPEAINTFEKIITDYSDRWKLMYSFCAVETYYYLGLAYETAGMTEDAIQQYEKFIDIWKDADNKTEILSDARERLTKLKNQS